MNRKPTYGAAVVLAAIAFCSPALAQNTGGRTDGPEGSEVGHGGYTSAGGGKFSLALNWGASVQETQPLGGGNAAPLFVGVTGGWWADDLLVLELSAAYLANNGRVNLLVGPKARTGFYPISLYIGLKAGAIYIPANQTSLSQNNTGLRFGLSPEVGADLLIRRKFVLGLGYAPDIAIGGNGLNHRLFMNIGYRF